jgi:dihydrofolate reductase
MRKLTYSMTMSLDGFIAGPDGDFRWGAPDEELHRFHNDRVREHGGQLLGRRLYETMLYWENPDPDWGATERDFAAVWRELPKIVYSTTLDEVTGSNTTLAREVVASEIEELKQQPGKDLEVGGATLAATFNRLGLIDEYNVFVSPVLVGGGTPFFGALDNQVDLELVDTRTFGSKVVYLRYRRA